MNIMIMHFAPSCETHCGHHLLLKELLSDWLLRSYKFHAEGLYFFLYFVQFNFEVWGLSE